MTALRSINRKATLQTEQAKPGQVKNNAGGYAFEVSDKSRLERFLILGVDGGTYYVEDKKFTNDTVNFLIQLISTNEDLVRETTLQISEQGRAHNNTPAIFVTALLMTDGKNKAATRAVFDRVVRTSTHLFQFAQFIENLGGWGRAKRNVVANWYQSKETDKLAYQMVKYRQRDGWSHADLLRLSHPTNLDSRLAEFALHGSVNKDVDILAGYRQMTECTTVNDVCITLTQYPRLPWETIPTRFLKDQSVWKSLFYNGQLNGQNAIRNVSRLNKIGAFHDMTFAADFAAKITDEDNIEKSRLHPINYLNAMAAFNREYVDDYSNATRVEAINPVVSDALDDGFHTAFKFVEPANKRTLLALDVSSSMNWTGTAGLNMSCAAAGAAMAMTIARREPYYAVMGFSHQFVDLEITPRQKLSTVMRKTQSVNFGSTDCSLPMLWALNNNIEVDTFVVITDSETWSGQMHPFQALKKYRRAMGIDSRLAVIAMAGTRFSIADPSDHGSMDFVGFDSNGPRALADFSAGRV